MAGVLREHESHAVRIGGVADHVHILCGISKNLPLTKVVEKVKSSSSKWLKTKGPGLENFYWQNGYGAFSVSQSNVDAIVAYIDDQKEHHRKMTFQEEYRQFLEKHKITFDERYVWD
jgi:REP element-mobilizing transposase RayT